MLNDGVLIYWIFYDKMGKNGKNEDGTKKKKIVYGEDDVQKISKWFHLIAEIGERNNVQWIGLVYLL